MKLTRFFASDRSAKATLPPYIEITAPLLLQAIGYQLLLTSTLDYLEFLVPLQLTHAVWELDTIEQFGLQVWLVLLALVLVFEVHGAVLQRIYVYLLRGMSSLALGLGILYLLLMPLGIVDSFRVCGDIEAKIQQQRDRQLEQIAQRQQTIETASEAELRSQAGPMAQNLSPEEIQAQAIQRLNNRAQQIKNQAQQSISQQQFQIFNRILPTELYLGIAVVGFFSIWRRTAWIRQPLQGVQSIEQLNLVHNPWVPTLPEFLKRWWDQQPLSDFLILPDRKPISHDRLSWGVGGCILVASGVSALVTIPQIFNLTPVDQLPILVQLRNLALLSLIGLFLLFNLRQQGFSKGMRRSFRRWRSLTLVLGWLCYGLVVFAGITGIEAREQMQAYLNREKIQQLTQLEKIETRVANASPDQIQNWLARAKDQTTDQADQTVPHDRETWLQHLRSKERQVNVSAELRRREEQGKILEATIEACLGLVLAGISFLTVWRLSKPTQRRPLFRLSSEFLLFESEPPSETPPSEMPPSETIELRSISPDETPPTVSPAVRPAAPFPFLRPSIAPLPSRFKPLLQGLGYCFFLLGLFNFITTIIPLRVTYLLWLDTVLQQILNDAWSLILGLVLIFVFQDYQPQKHYFLILRRLSFLTLVLGIFYGSCLFVGLFNNSYLYFRYSAESETTLQKNVENLEESRSNVQSLSPQELQQDFAPLSDANSPDQLEKSILATLDRQEDLARAQTKASIRMASKIWVKNALRLFLAFFSLSLLTYWIWLLNRWLRFPWKTYS